MWHYWALEQLNYENSYIIYYIPQPKGIVAGVIKAQHAWCFVLNIFSGKSTFTKQIFERSEKQRIQHIFERSKKAKNTHIDT